MIDWLTHDQFCSSRWPNPFSELDPTMPRYQVDSSETLRSNPRIGAGTRNRKTPVNATMLAAAAQCRRHTRYGSTATGKTFIARPTANMLPAPHGRPCCSHQNPNSIIASSTRFGWPRSNMSNTNVMVTKPGNAASHGPGILPKPVIAFESWLVIHHAAALSNDRHR